MKPAAGRATDLRRSEIRVLFDVAAKRPDVIRLEVGEPSHVTPLHIIDAAAQAARDGHTGYGPNGGLLSLRLLLAEKLRRVNRFDADPHEIVVTPGGMNALYSTYLALVETGDEVLLPTPGFPNMDEMVRLVGGSPVFYELEASNQYLPDLARLESLVTNRTKVLFINTPGNPTGAVFGADLVRSLVEFARRHDLWLVSDEVYDEMVLTPDAQHTSATRFDQDGRVVTVFSFSKIYAMTGWRVGYVVAAAGLAQLLRTLQEPQVSCPSTISQKAAEAALTGPREPIHQMLESYRRRRTLAIEAASIAGLEVVEPSGALYMMVNTSAAGMPSLDFAMYLLQEHGVSVAPGTVFGPAGQGWVRISLAAPDDAITEGVHRIGEAVRLGKTVSV